MRPLLVLLAAAGPRRRHGTKTERIRDRQQPIAGHSGFQHSQKLVAIPGIPTNWCLANPEHDLEMEPNFDNQALPSAGASVLSLF